MDEALLPRQERSGTRKSEDQGASVVTAGTLGPAAGDRSLRLSRPGELINLSSAGSNSLVGSRLDPGRLSTLSGKMELPEVVEERDEEGRRVGEGTDRMKDAKAMLQLTSEHPTQTGPDRSDEAGPPSLQLFQNKKAYDRAWCCGRLFFTWVSPLLNHTKKHQRLLFEQMGDLPDRDRVELHLNRLKNAWQTRRDGGLRRNTLISAVFASFRREYFRLIVYNAIQAVLTLLGPFFVHFLVDYVKTGQNPYAADLHFFDTSGIDRLEWLTQEMQYGMALALCLVVSQGIAYVLAENTSYRQQMIGAKSTNALIGLIYDK